MESITTLTNEKSVHQALKDEVVRSQDKSDIINGQPQNNNISDNKSVDIKSKDAAVEVKKEKKPTFEDDDPFAALDWKDGIATLPGTLFTTYCLSYIYWDFSDIFFLFLIKVHVAGVMLIEDRA